MSAQFILFIAILLLKVCDFSARRVHDKRE